MMRLTMITLAVLCLWRCDSEHEHVDEVKDCPAALAVFKSSIQPKITTQSCDQSGCHASAQDSGHFALKTGEKHAVNNRKGLLHEAEHDEFSMDAAKLYAFITSDEHPGNDKLNGLAQSDIAAWLKAEKGCK